MPSETSGHGLDQKLGSILEAWINRDVHQGNCRFCNEPLEGPETPQDQFCDETCQEGFDDVQNARIAIGKRDLQQRGYD